MKHPTLPLLVILTAFTSLMSCGGGDDDDLVPPINSANYYQEFIRHDVPASVHVFPTGGHGWGYRESFDYHLELLLELKAWLHSF